LNQKAKQFLFRGVAVLSMIVSGCAGEELPESVADDEALTRSASLVADSSKVSMCNLPRQTARATLRLCGYVTPGLDGTRIAGSWFKVDGGADMAVVPGSGGFVDTSTTLSEGTHTVRLYARSVAGNVTVEEKQVTVDLTPPVLKVLSPTPADVLTNTVVNVTSSVADATSVRVQTQWVKSSVVEGGTGAVTHTVDLVNRGYKKLLVRATDAVGNVSEAAVQVYFCPTSDAACAASALWSPVVVSTSQSSPTVPASGGITLRVVASDPQGSPLSFSWTASVGTLGTPVGGATTSEVVWTPPSCFAAGTPPVLKATVTNARGRSVSASFSVSGGRTCEQVPAEPCANAVGTGMYKGYICESNHVAIMTQDSTCKAAYDNCVLNASLNPHRSFYCTWKGLLIHRREVSAGACDGLTIR
jgi:hypothetical protein